MFKAGSSPKTISYGVIGLRTISYYSNPYHPDCLVSLELMSTLTMGGHGMIASGKRGENRQRRSNSPAKITRDKRSA
jgi:hypothetical protein